MRTRGRSPRKPIIRAKMLASAKILRERGPAEREHSNENGAPDVAEQTHLLEHTGGDSSASSVTGFRDSVVVLGVARER